MLFRSFGPRADETHITLEYIDQLRKFIQFRPPKKPAHPCNARVVADRDWSTFPRGIRNHSPKLIDEEWTKVPTDPFLSEEYWSMRIELDKYSD